MKKNFKKALSVILAMVMVFSLAVPSFAATKDDVKQYNRFTMIGDSVASGFGLQNVVENGTYNHFYRNDQSFPDQVATAVGIERGSANYHPLTCASVRVIDFLYMMGKAPEGYDFEVASKFLGSSIQKKISAVMTKEDPTGAIDYGDTDNTMRADIMESITGSDLIGIELGFNDVFWYPASVALEYANEVDGDIVKILVKFLSLIFEGYVQFVKYYPVMLEEIRKVNPDADIFLVGMYNPATNITINEGDKFAVGKLFNIVTGTLNLFTRLWAMKYDCTYIDVTDLEPDIAGLNLMEALNGGLDFRDGGWDAHPSLEGHNLITKQVLGKLPEKK